MANFASALRKESTKTYTENGAQALNSTLNSCLDLFGSIGSLRTRQDNEVIRLFSEAYNEDPLLATKILFYARDIREGCGERKTFRTIIRYLASMHPNALLPNLNLIGEYGRYDDLYSLIGTPLEEDMWQVMRHQFELDRVAMHKNETISLLSKWIKTPDASSKNTRKLGILTAQKLGYTVYRFKRILREMRRYLKIVEVNMSANKWNTIDYSTVPSRAMHIYNNAFQKHDEVRFEEFKNKAIQGEAKVNSSTLYPYDIVQKIIDWSDWRRVGAKEDKLCEAQWRQLPNYVEGNQNAIVIADTSGSMTCSACRPMASSIGLAIYFAERNHGPYKDLFIPFSTTSSVCRITGETLAQKIDSINDSGYFGYCGSTNLAAAFVRILDIAIDNHISNEDMVKSLIVISDMEIDCQVEDHGDWTFYDQMSTLYSNYGYTLPNVIFWNVESRHNIFHADANRKGVQLVSGSSIATFKQLMGSVGLTPVEMMLKVINSDRYSPITID